MAQTFSFEEAIKPPKTFSFEEAAGVAMPLPAGVAPSTAGGGRGAQGSAPAGAAQAYEAERTQRIQSLARAAPDMGANTISPEFGELPQQAEPMPPQPARGRSPQVDASFLPAGYTAKQAGRDFMGGVETVKSIGAGVGAFAGASVFKEASNTLAGLDAIDAGQRPPSDAVAGGVSPLMAAYNQSGPDERAQMRAEVTQRLASSREFVGESIKMIQGFSAKAQELTGKMPDFTDARTARELGVWLVRHGINGTPTMAAAMIGAAAGVPGLAATSMATAVGDMTQERAQFTGQTSDPQRFRTADRAADAAAAQPDQQARYLANNADTTLALAPAYAAGDVLLGPAARLAKSAAQPVAAQTVRQVLGREVRALPGQAAEEFVGEGPIQGGVNIAASALAGERSGQLTAEDAKSLFNEGMAGAAASPGGAAVKAATDSARVLLRPTEQRKAINDQLDDVAAEHGLSRAAVDAAKKAAETKPLAEVPGFFKKYTASILRRMGRQDADQAAAVFDQPAAADRAAEFMAAADALERAGSQAIPAADLLDDGTGLADPPPRTAVDDAAHEAASSPENDRSDPTPGQAEAGNYKLGKPQVGPLKVHVENPANSVRRGADEDGNAWESRMTAHYGYLPGTVAYDSTRTKKQGVDAFIKPGTPEDYSGPVFVVDQINPKTGRFDEHKSVIGAATSAEAESIYRSNYAPDWQGFGGVTQLPMPAFKAWAYSSQPKKGALGSLNATAAGTGRDGAPGPADQQRSDGSTSVLGQPRGVAVDAGPADGQDFLGVRADAVRPAPDTARDDALSAAPAQEAALDPGPVEVTWNGKGGRGMARQALPEHRNDLRKKYPDLEFTPAPAPEFGENRWKLEGRKKNAAPAAPPASAAATSQGASADEKGQAQGARQEDGQAQADVLKPPAGAKQPAGPRNTHPKTVMGSRLLALVSEKVRGLDPSLLSEFSARQETRRKGKDGRPITAWRNPMIPGVGTLFRAGGAQDYQQIAELLEGEGYLEPGSVERDSTEAGERAKDLIKRALIAKDEPQTIDQMIAEAQTNLDAEIAEHQAQSDRDRAEADAEAAAERAAIMNEAQIGSMGMDSIDDSDIPFDWPGKTDDTQASTQDQNAEKAGRAEAESASEVRAPDAARSEEAGDEEGLTDPFLLDKQELNRRLSAIVAADDAADLIRAFQVLRKRYVEATGKPSIPPAGSRYFPMYPDGLTSPTPEGLRAAEDRVRTADAADRAEQKRLADKARADAERDEFTLTGSNSKADQAAAAGQRGMFDEPAQSQPKPEAAPAKSEPVSQRKRDAETERVIELRKRESVLTSLIKCLEAA